MRPDRTDLVFAALAHASRRRILDLLTESPGLSVKALASHFDVSRIMVLKHLRTLEAVDLVLSRKEGRMRRLFFNPVPIQAIYDRWTDRYSAFWSARMTDIKSRVETRAKGKENKRA
jgi:DNA-binding transcriptional ArsR family regulator